MKNRFLLLAFTIVCLNFFSCTPSPNNPSPAFVTPTPVVSNINVTGYFRCDVNGVLFNAPILTVQIKDTEAVIGGAQGSTTSGQSLTWGASNFYTVAPSTYQIVSFTNPAPFSILYVSYPYDDTGTHMLPIPLSGTATITNITAHHIQGTFNYWRQDSIHITNGQMDISW